MELVGENRIQTLFSEQRLADEQTLPSFVAVWNRAQTKTYRPQRAFNLAFAGAAAVLVCALAAAALWSRQWQPDRRALVSVPSSTTAGPEQIVAATKDPEPKRWEQPRSSSKSRALRLAARRQALLLAANRKAAHEVKALASWQSPTATLLDSPSDELLKSLPQLSRAVDELKSFLPSSPK